LVDAKFPKEEATKEGETTSLKNYSRGKNCMACFSLLVKHERGEKGGNKKQSSSESDDREKTPGKY